VSPDINILLTGAGTQTFANVINPLKDYYRNRVKLVACDMDPMAYGLYLADKSYIIPPAVNSNFIKRIVEICRLESVKIILPLLSLDMLPISKHKKEFADMGVSAPISDYKSIKICSDKKLTYDFFRHHNIPTPATYLPDELPGKLDFPVIVKPRHLSGSKFFQKVNSRDELPKITGCVPDPIIQSFLNGQEYTVDILADLESRPVGIVPRSRLKISSGKSVVGKTEDLPVLRKLIEYVIKKIPLIGPANIQCFKINGNFLFTEVNPRFSAGGLPLSVSAGMNSPVQLVKIALGQTVPKLTKNYNNLYLFRYYTEVIVTEKKIIK